MKHQPVDNGSPEDEIDLTPMLDVVFILLIFFIVTATFVREAGLPANRSNDNIETKSVSESILVQIDDSDHVWIEGRVVDPRALRANLERLNAQSPEYPVILQPSALSTTDTLVAVMDAARLVEVPNVMIAAETPP